jgi:hypothetical protein
MKYELAKKEARKAATISDLLDKYVSDPIRGVSTAGTEVIKRLPGADLAQAAMSLGSGIFAMPASVPYAIGKEVASGDFGEARGKQVAGKNFEDAMRELTYVPRTEGGRDIMEGIAKAIEVSKLPPYIGHVYTPRTPLSANDVRVLAKRGIETGREIAAIPDDFLMAQQGLRRESNLGGTTYGAKLQGVADDVGDVLARQAARRADEGTVRMPGSVEVFGDMVPETKLYAVKPAGGQLVKAIDPVTGNLREVENSSVAGISNVYENIRKQTEGQGLINQYLRTFVNRPGVQEIWEDFNAKKVNEEFPGAPTPEQAREAFQVKYPTAKARNERMTTFFDEFAASPEAQAAAADIGIKIPTFEDYQKRIDAANTWAQKGFANYIQKFVGSKEDPALQLATQGITFKSPERLTESAADALNYASPTGLREDRVKAGFSPEGEVQPFLKEKLTELKAVDDQLREMVTKRNALYEQAQTSNVDPASIPEYAELTNKLASKVAEKERITQQAENYKLGKSYETLADLAIEPRTAKELKRKLTFAEKQLFPYLDKTPDEATLYDVNQTTIDRLGLTEMASMFMDDIVSGKIPVDQIGNISIPKYIQESASARIAKDAAAKKDLAAQQRLLDNYLQEQVQRIPGDKIFGNAGVLEITNAMTIEEIRKHLSADTQALDHCVGQGGRGDRGNQYVPMVDPVTGEVPKGSSGEDTSYVRNISKNGDKIASFRDLVTGKPVGTLQLSANGAGEFDIGYASGYQNGRMQSTYSDSLASYLNSISDQIAGSGDNLTKNGVLDKDNLTRRDMRDVTGLSENELNQLSFDGMPRFLTRDAIVALNNERKSMLPSAQLNSEAATLNTSYAELLDESQRLNFDLQNADDDMVREELMSRRSEIQGQLNDIGTRIGNMPLEEITTFARELINDVFPENKKTPRSRLQYLDNESPIGLRIQPRVYETMRDILRDERDAVGAPLSDVQQSAVRSEWRRVSHDVARTINGNMYNGRAVANNIRRNPERYDLGEYSAQIIDGIARQVEERGIIDPRNDSLPLIREADSTLPNFIRERLNTLIGNAVRSSTDEGLTQAIGQLRQYQEAYQNPPAQSMVRDLTENQRLEAIGELQRRIDVIEQRMQRPPLVNSALPGAQQQDLGIVLHRLGEAIDEDYGTAVGEYTREAMNTIRYSVDTDAPLFIEQLRRMADNEQDPEVVSAMNMVANRLVQGVQANTAAARALREQNAQLAAPVQEPREAQDLTGVLNMEMNRVRDNYDERVYNTVDALMTSINDNFDLNANPEMFIDRLRRHARMSDDVIVGDVFTHAADLLERTLRENNEIDRRPPPDIFENGIEAQPVRNNVGNIVQNLINQYPERNQIQALINDLERGAYDELPMAVINADEIVRDDTVSQILEQLEEYRDSVPAVRQARRDEGENMPITQSYQIYLDEINNAIEEGSFDPNDYTFNELAQMVIDDQVGGQIGDLSPASRQRLADEIREHGVDPYHEPDEDPRVIDEEPRAALPAVEVRPNVRHGTNVMDAYYEILRDNNQFRTADEMDALRALPQLIRRPGATRNALGIGQFDTERANQLARIFEALYEARMQDFARNENNRLTPPEPEGRKAGGYIQSSKNRLLSPNTDEMRLALLKGK